VTLLRITITTRCFAWRRASINSVDVHFSAVQLRTVRRSSRKILTYDSYSAAVFPWDRHVAKAKLSETRPRRVASPLFIVLLESVSIACNLDNAGDLSARGQELVQCAASYVISRILLVIPSHPRHGTTCFANNIDRRRPITSRTCHLIARHDTRSIKIKTPSPPAMSRCRLTGSHDRGGLSSSMRPMSGDVSKRYRFHRKFRSDGFADTLLFCATLWHVISY